jgi:nucleoid-associated protein YgaU
LWGCRPTRLPATAGPDRLVLAAAAWAAWLLAAYLAVAVAACAAARASRRATALARAVEHATPAAVRRLVEMVAGASVVAAVVTGSPAWADRGPAPRPPAAVDLDWPGLTAPAPWAAPPLPPPAPPPASRTAAAAPPAPGSGETVVVRPGDTLWAIAARHLPADAAPARVAAAWPLWWAANRAVIGADPGLIHPGQRLAVPAASRSTP